MHVLVTQNFHTKKSFHLEELWRLAAYARDFLNLSTVIIYLQFIQDCSQTQTNQLIASKHEDYLITFWKNKIICNIPADTRLLA